jgi:hypothetical protein
MRKSNRKNVVTEIVNTRRAKNHLRFIRTSFNVQKTKSLLLLSIFSLSTLATILSGPLTLATPSPDVSIEQCTAEKGKWQSDNSSGWCSVAPADRNPKFVGQAWAVTNAFYRCVANSDHQLIDNTPVGQRITEEHMRSGTWFKDNATQDIFSGAPFKVASSFLVDNVGERGEVLCNTTIKEVADLTGYGTDYRSMYCDVIPVKADGTSCTGDSGDFSGTGRGGGQLYTYADDFYNMIKRKAFRAEAPPMTGAARYLIYLSAFQGSNGCHANPTASPGNNENKIYRNIKIVNSTGTGIDQKTFEGEIRTDKRWVFTDQTGRDQEMRCQDIADQLNANADEFLAWAKRHPNEVTATLAVQDGGTKAGTGTNTPTCAIEAIGWIICPVMRFMSQIVDQAYGAISTMLNTPAIDTSTSDTNPMYKAWSTMRSFANIVFVIGFLVIIFSQLTSVGLTNYGIKKMLPRLIVAAILVNISYWICAVAVDISNILGVSLKSLMNTTGSSLYVNAGVADSGAGGIWDGLTVGLLASTAAITVIYLGVSILLPMLIAATLAIVTVVLVLTLRQALIIILVVISPLAFVAYLLPNTEKWFTKWRELFQVLLLMFPIIAVVFGGSALASTIISGVANSSAKPNFILQVMAAGITIIPLFIVPVVMKTAGGLLNRFGGMVNNPNKGPFDRMRKGAATLREESKVNRGLRAMDPTKRSMPGRRSFINYANRRKAIASGRSEQLQEMQKEDIARLATDPNSNFAQKVAGNGEGKAALYAAKQQSYLASIDPDKLKLEVDKSQIANMVGTLKLSVKDPANMVSEMQTVLNEAAASGDEIKARSALEILRNSGNKGKSALRQSLQNIDPNSAVGTELRKDIASSDMKNSAADVYAWSVDKTHRSLSAISADKGTWSGLSDVQISTQIADSLRSATSSNGITSQKAAEVLASRAAEQIGSDERAILQQHAGTSGAPATPLNIPHNNPNTGRTSPPPNSNGGNTGPGGLWTP